MDMYRQTILDHYKNPRCFGHLTRVDATAEENNTSCGDRVVFELAFDKTRTRVSDVRFSGEGCAISQAASSMLAERIRGMDLESVLALGKDDVISMLGVELTPSRIKCALLPLEVVHAALKTFVNAKSSIHTRRNHG